ncbi:cysteine-rich receptor-like protein kinase 1 [Primulina huaijiensis]|uniref:cysteine-rich receptor-like protein kinase 1 n=1 Tax=Primulina huaijiensis TaxID=1492673 RepID=UPI003CC75835
MNGKKQRTRIRKGNYPSNDFAADPLEKSRNLQKNFDPMHLIGFVFRHRCLVFSIVLIFFFFPASYSDPRIVLAGFSCRTFQISGNRNLRRNYMHAMQALNDLSNFDYFGMRSVLSPEPQIYSIFQCHNDLSPQDCHICFDEAKKKLTDCLPAIGGSIFLEGCFLRYEQYNFFNETNEKIDHLEPLCHNPTDITSDKYMKMEFANKVHQAVTEVTEFAGSTKGFGASEGKSGLLGVYALGQCLENLDHKNCTECLSDAGAEIDKCLPGAEGHVMNAGCYLRYSTRKFFGDAALAAQNEKEQVDHNNVAVLVFTMLSIVILLFSGLGAFIGCQIYARNKQEHRKVSRLPSSIRSSELNFKYEILEKATDFFHPTNKLGQGGAGSVYKGLLSDGTAVAVKRLFFNSRQWADEFFNEVHSVSGIQHKNLVRLLGCSIEGPESLLVYEFVPNKNLDQMLFDRKTFQLLSWDQRFNIILGIAEGIAHLHEGCKVKIIHRDIKSSNILVDNTLTPKVADFGLARSVAHNKTHISTGVAGTVGYLAPEYLVQGCLTEKADIYAFGVLAIEIACGRKNSIFAHDSGSILQCVWKNYKSKTITEAIDSKLRGEFQESEASRVLQIGLLCTQTRRSLRPSMSEVVQMLKTDDAVVPSPQQRPFQNSSMLSSDGTTKSLEMNSSSSNRHSTVDIKSSMTNTQSNKTPSWDMEMSKQT